MIIRETSPLNLEMPFATLDGFITSNEHFYLRNHFPIPQLETKAWRLKIEGAVETTLDLGYDELLQMEMQTITGTLECAGNGRAFLKPPPDATLWELGAVGNPSAFLADDLRKDFAKALLNAPPPPRAEPVKYHQWGEGLDHEAVMQMEKACLLPVSVAGALMPDAGERPED